MTGGKRELSYQNRIIESYSLYEGFARKWATNLYVGMPDLICALPGYGLHLIEVKHHPVDPKKLSTFPDPRTPRQAFAALKYTNAGGEVYLGVVTGDVLSNSALRLVPHRAIVNHRVPMDGPRVRWDARKKYDMPRLIAEVKEHFATTVGQ